ncbi:MAG: MerR family transcriptional regulator [Burkholderiales bacterium]|nr:MerR family transcriptional regulator [Burkholderiales bacterium]
MLLKVGELAKHTGLTVRTLHHYDAIGLLKPTGRSDSGYRLYGTDDVARLHGIQALRHLGLALGDVAGLLDGEDAQPGRIIERQMEALDAEIAQATELRGRLALMHAGLVTGAQPGMEDWLGTLALMATYGKYFSAAELKRIFASWKAIEGEWVPLMAQVRTAMDSGLAPDSPQVQPLINRWMTLMINWMDGDFNLIERWGRMFRDEPSAHGRNNAPEGDMIDYVTRGVDVRMALMGKYLSPQQLRRIGKVAPAEWRALEDSVNGLLRGGVPPQSPAAKEAAACWQGLVGRLAGGDAEMGAALRAAWAAEPLLAAGSSLSAPVRAYLAKSIPESA